jgi:hypothetical protein
MNEDSAVVVIRPSEIERCKAVLDAHRDELAGNNPGFKL